MPGESQQVPDSRADPTVLTTEQLLREVGNAAKLVMAEMEGLENTTLEQFKSVEKQFTLIERQRVEQKADTEKAVQAALSAAKEAVKEQTAASDKSITKSETAMTEQLKQLTATFTTAIGGVTDILNDLKERVGKIESVRQGSIENRTANSASANLVIGAVGLFLTVLIIAVAVYAATQ